MLYARVTGGMAANGGGIANVGGTLTLFQSLVDNNTATNLGGGVLTRDGTGSPTFDAYNSTIGLNAAGNGGGLAVSTSANNTSLVGVTLARNAASNPDGGAGGVLLATPSSDIDVDASLVASNTSVNCGGPGSLFENTGGSREDGTSCGFSAPGSGVSVSTALVNAGGDTDVFTIPASPPTGGAKNAVAPCPLPYDQRLAPRPASACDAGAFQEGAEAPPISDGAYPEPPPPGGGGTQPTPTPTPVAPQVTPTPPPIPTPVAKQTVVVRELSGSIRIRVRGTNKFVDFDATKGIPLGSEIDTRKGVVELTSVSKPGAPPEKAKFHDGIFKVTQSGGITVLTLTERLAPCSKKARSAATKPKTRRLWGDGKGKFRTSGKYAAATVRGTEWLVQDTCAGTLVRVKQGTVTVRDTVRKKNILLRAPKKYLAKPK
jgi:hypothetical protein